MDEISKIIERVVRERFQGVDIDAVKVAQDTDYENEAVFRVTIVLDHKGPLDAQKTAGLVRHIRHELLKQREDTFPIVAFVSKSDAARMGAEAA